MTKWGPLETRHLKGGLHYKPRPCLSVKCVFDFVLVFCRHECVFLCVCMPRCVLPFEYTCVQLWLSSATLILYLNVFKLILCVCPDVVAVVFPCSKQYLCVLYVCVCVVDMCVTCVNVRVFVSVYVW